MDKISCDRVKKGLKNVDAIQNSQNKVGKINIAIGGYIFIIISCGAVCTTYSKLYSTLPSKIGSSALLKHENKVLIDSTGIQSKLLEIHIIESPSVNRIMLLRQLKLIASLHFVSHIIFNLLLRGVNDRKVMRGETPL